MGDCGTPCDCRNVNKIAKTPKGGGRGEDKPAKQGKGRGGEHTINGTDGEAEPTVLMSVQREEDDEICDGRQDDGRGAQSGPPHEELARGDRVAQTGDLAEGQGHGDAGQGVLEAADLDQTRAAQDEDEGEGEVDEDVVRQERYGDDEGQADAALAVHTGERSDRVDEGEDGQHAEAEEDDGDA